MRRLWNAAKLTGPTLGQSNKTEQDRKLLISSFLISVARDIPYWLAREVGCGDSRLKDLAGRATRKAGAATGRVMCGLAEPEASPAHQIHCFIDLDA